ncbi:thioesterase family protein [Rubellicoccus peritrichatus]|uniref:Thioesterase family protein n=1 Tax=Rubellicoccus peritrichatus TaxID=3080537 RepID=A0AAQ3LAQ3_9BACT|nr:thioesterase family protein [Puniceicoccus sp. CR14]WOO42380.1 thioesterase family protein [Puniceicoccus sp. CR14]
MIESTCEIRVRYAETDKMGFVYHSNYFIWFEAARVQMLDELGLPYTEIEANGLMLPLIECSAKFSRPARFDDRVKIHLSIPEKPRLRLKVHYKVTCKEVHLAEGFTQHVFVDLEGRPAKPPASFMALVNKLF